MKSIKRLALGVASLAVTASVWCATLSEAATTEPPKTIVESQTAMIEVQKAKKSITNYIDAIEKRDVDEIVKWVKDTRFTSVEQQKREYKEMFDNDPFGKAIVTDVKKVDDNNMIVSLKLIRKGSGKPQSLDLPIIKEDGQWKLLITGVETRE